MSRLLARTPGHEGEGESVSRADRARVLLGVAVGPVVCGYAVVVTVLTVVIAVAPRAEFSVGGVLAASGLAWLAAYQVPLELSGAVLGVLPLLPTVGSSVLVARAASGAARKLGDLRPSTTVPVIVAVAGTHALVASVVVVLSAGTAVAAHLPQGVLTPALLSGLFALAGAGHARLTTSSGIVVWWRERVDPVAARGMRAGLLGFVALASAGLMVLLVATVAALPRLSGSFSATAPEVGSGAGMLLLSLGYLPNVVLLCLGFVAGPGFAIGLVSVSPFDLVSGAVPPVAVLAGMPGQYSAWWLLLLVLPAAVGALVGWSVREVDPSPVARVRAIAVAGVVAALVTVALGPLAGGGLGGGVFDPVTMRVELSSVAVFGWIVVFGAPTAWFAGPRGSASPSRGRGHGRSAPRRR